MTQNISKEDLVIWQEAVKGVTSLDMPTDVTSSQPSVVRSYPHAEWMPHTHDLHGFTVEGAYRYMVALLDELQNHNYGVVRIITGKSGQIRQEFPAWMQTSRLSLHIRKIHIESTGGSFIVWLR
jgi:DNA-nicking Smr family endonuclease